MSDWAKAAADIHAAFADPVIYTGAGLDGATIAAIKHDDAAAAFPGGGSTARHVWFEVRQAHLPDRPGKGNLIVHADPMTGETTRWSVIDRKRRDDIGGWDLTVEKAA